MITGRMAIVNDINEADLDKAKLILKLNSFKRCDHPEEVLKLYYSLGDESVLEEKFIVEPRVALELEEME